MFLHLCISLMDLLITGMLLALEMSVQTVGGVVHDEKGATDMTDLHLVLLTKDGVDIVVLFQVLEICLHLFDLSGQGLGFVHATFLTGFFDLGKGVLDLLFEHDNLFLFFILTRVEEL